MVIEMEDRNLLHINEQITLSLDELQFRFSASSGPGGQHVNKTESKVTLFFDIAHSPSLNEEARARLLHKLANRLDKEGVLQIQVQESRSQLKNRETAVSRLQQLLAEALKRPKPRRKTKPSPTAREKRLQEKKQHSQKKQNRQQEWE